MPGRRSLYELIDGTLGNGAKDAVKIAADTVLIVLAASWAWFASSEQAPRPGSPLPFLVTVLAARLPLYFAFRLHRMCWRSVSRFDVVRLAETAILGFPLIVLLYVVLPEPFTLSGLVRPYLILPTEAALYLLLLSGIRITARAVASNVRRNGNSRRRTLIIGAGDMGLALAFQIRESNSQYEVLGFLDDDPYKRGKLIRGLPVLGGIDDLPTIALRVRAEQVIVAIPSIHPDRLRHVLAMSKSAELPIRILPPSQGSTGQGPQPAALREVQMEDLLPRLEVMLDGEAITRFLRGKSVLVTGGGGSIGRELCRQVLKAGAGHLVVLGRGENSVFEAMQELSECDSDCQVTPVVCDVRDRDALTEVFAAHRPQVVLHAAAHKHVPLMELYPAEAVKNNVLGTLNVVELAVAHGVERLVNVSTDKAVNPSSVMGATKRIGEMIVQAYAVAHGANMVSVRFGNVLGSRGSVVRVMQRQIERRLPVTITDPEMVRYFMTIPEAVQLVLQAGAVGGQGEVFVLDMGHPMRILGLARDLIRLSGLIPEQDIPIRVIGRRPGEKMKEELLTAGETKRASGNGQFHVAPLRQVELSGVQALVAQLSVAAANGGKPSLLPLIREAVPEFAPEGLANGSPVAPTQPHSR